jgi:hypothetical protein
MFPPCLTGITRAALGERILYSAERRLFVMREARSIISADQPPHSLCRPFTEAVVVVHTFPGEAQHCCLWFNTVVLAFRDGVDAVSGMAGMAGMNRQMAAQARSRDIQQILDAILLQ